MAKDLVKIAEKNCHYYLTEQKSENNDDRWFRYVKTMDTYSEPVMISPEMAKELLESCEENIDLRKPLDQTDHKTISINFAGKLLDGRLILETIVLNNKSLLVFVSFNVSDKLNFFFEH